MVTQLDRLSPSYIGEDRISIRLDDVNLEPIVNRPITILFDYEDAEPDGVVLPLVLEISPAFGDGAEYRKEIFRSMIPSSYSFEVPTPGQYLLLIQESAHNRWQGRLLINVAGDIFQKLGRV